MAVPSSPAIAGAKLGAKLPKRKHLQTFAVWTVFLFMLPGILHYVIFRLFPSVMTAVFSFTDIQQSMFAQGFKFIGFANYREFFVLQNVRDLTATLGRTAIYGVVVTIAQNVFALFFAVVLNQKFLRGSAFYRAAIFLPIILGVTVVATVWKLMFSVPSGPVFVFMLNVLGIAQPPAILSDFTYAFPVVIFVQVWMHTGYTMLIYLAALQGIPADMYEAANIDGASEWQVFSRITVPLIWSTVVVNALICIIGALQSFEIIMTLTSGQFNTSTLGMQVFANAFGGRGASAGGGAPASVRQGYAAAQSMVLFVVVFFMTIVSQRIMSRKED